MGFQRVVIRAAVIWRFREQQGSAAHQHAKGICKIPIEGGDTTPMHCYLKLFLWMRAFLWPMSWLAIAYIVFLQYLDIINMQCGGM